MRIPLSDLKLERPDVIHVGDDTFPLPARVRPPLSRLLEDLQPLPQ